MTEIKKNTETLTLYVKLRELKPKGGGSLRDAVSEISRRLERQEDTKNSFISASKLLEKKNTHFKSDVKTSRSKNVENKKVSYVNPDPLMQTMLDSYYTKGEIYAEKSASLDSIQSDDFKLNGSSDNCESDREFACEEYDEDDVMEIDNEIEKISEQDDIQSENSDKILDYHNVNAYSEKSDDALYISLSHVTNEQTRNTNISFKDYDNVLENSNELIFMKEQDKQMSNQNSVSVSFKDVKKEGKNGIIIKQDTTLRQSLHLFDFDSSSSKTKEIKLKNNGRSSTDDILDLELKNYDKQSHTRSREFIKLLRLESI